MNREILFRGKRVDNGEWIYGYYFYDNQNEKGYITFGNNTYKIKLFGEGYNNYQVTAFEVIPETVGRYTGLTDKNGTKIFEGDILECNNNPKDLVKVVFGEFDVIEVDTLHVIDTVIGWHYEVVPTDALSRCEPFNTSMPLTDFYIQYLCNMQIIGNIYDNPELLEASK